MILQSAGQVRKNWKILRDCRQRGDGLHHAVATMHNLAMAR
ncbi:hypothetical protein SAMN05428944_0239 [Streptomyces sp. 1222.5]|nr:hypothetical protein BX260_7854 [Streptomyces sp. 5112.2]SEB55529.1 hypothetical protein SAMN05428944_0239 [Streptomyces sp. 1222.5]